MPGKNLANLGGRPLVEWPIRAALGSEAIGPIWCSTDDPEIGEIAERVGARFAGPRPPKLSTNSSLVVDTLRFELARIRSTGEDPSHLCLLQATSPFVLPADIDAAVDLAETGSFDVVCTGQAVGADHPDAMFELSDNRSVAWLLESSNRSRRRQDGPRLLVRSGLVYVFRSEHLLRCGDDYFDGRVGCIEVPSLRAQSIDTLLDLEWCRLLLSKFPDQLQGEST